MKKMEDTENKYFIRFQAEDRFGVMGSIASVFGNNCVSLSQVIQKQSTGKVAEIVVDQRRIGAGKRSEDCLAVLGDVDCEGDIFGDSGV